MTQARSRELQAGIARLRQAAAPGDQAHGKRRDKIDHILRQDHDRGALLRRKPPGHELGERIEDSSTQGEERRRMDRRPVRPADDQPRPEAHENGEPTAEPDAFAQDRPGQRHEKERAGTRTSETAAARGRAAMER